MPAYYWAAHTIEGQLTHSNYLEAIAPLKKRYGRAHKIISCYMKALWELPRTNVNIESIKDFYDNTESDIRGLRSLGKTEDAYELSKHKYLANMVIRHGLSQN